MKKVLTFMCMLFVLIITGCQCDLSHKHYYNDYGVCMCGDDIAQELIYENQEYKTTSHEVKQGETYYYKFVSHGENGIDFYLESESVAFDRIEIRADNMLQTVAGRKDYTNKLYTYESSLTDELMYYLKITYTGEGTIKMIIKNIE